MVQVSHREAPPFALGQSPEQVKQNHRILPAGNSHQDFLAGHEQPMVKNALSYLGW
jgi:hypothetical protein